jgi:hypothetical protein
MGRFSLARGLGVVAAIAVGLGLLRDGSNWCSGAMLTLTLGLLFASLLGAMIHGVSEGAWLGFALFGWGFFLLQFIPTVEYRLRMVTDAPAEWIFSHTNLKPANQALAEPDSVRYYRMHYWQRSENSREIAKLVFVLLSGLFGSFLGRALANGRSKAGTGGGDATRRPAIGGGVPPRGARHDRWPQVDPLGPR